MIIVSKKIRTNLLETQAKNISFYSQMKNNPIVWFRTEKDIEDARGYINGVREILASVSNPYRLDAFFHFNIYRYYYFFYKLYGICSKFFVLLETYYLIEKDTDFYAKKLNISKGHLDFTLKKKIGKTAKAFSKLFKRVTGVSPSKLRK